MAPTQAFVCYRSVAPGTNLTLPIGPSRISFYRRAAWVAPDKRAALVCPAIPNRPQFRQRDIQMKIVINSRSGVLLTAVVALLVVSSNVGAHHALNAFYDLENPIRIDGTLTSVRWVNPHISFELEQIAPDGQTKVWTVASGAPALVNRAGINADTFSVGDQVVISGFPSKRRENEMVGAIIHMEDGRDLAMFKGLAARFGHELSASSTHISADAAQAGARDARSIFRVWTFDENPGRVSSEPEFLQSAIDARADYDPLTDDPALSCTPRGMPFAMRNRFPIEFIAQPETIVLRLEMWDITRTIHMGEDAAGGSRQASPLGYSVGRWDDGSLVVTTRDINWPYFDEIGTLQSSAIGVEERFTLSEDEAALEYQITITDPNTLSHPAVRYGRWLWIPGEEIQPYGCTVISTD